MIGRHIHSEYDEALDSLRGDFSQMFDLVERMLSGAREALLASDISIGEEARKLDRQVDELDNHVCESIVRILAQWQPLASDLRFILACSRSVGHLERVGDYIRNICKRLRHIIGCGDLLPFARDRLLLMIVHVDEMLGLARVAFLEQRSDSCGSIIAMDNTLDALHKEVFASLRSEMVKGCDVEVALEALLVSKNLERMGDHITNIAEMVVFSVNADMYERRKVL